MKKFLLALILLNSTVYFAQISTPNTGVKWNLDSLVTNFPAAFSLDTLVYAQTQDLLVSKTDTLLLDQSTKWIADSGVRITVAGTFRCEGNLLLGNEIKISAFDSTSTFDGFRFEDSSSVYLSNTFISRSGGLRVLTEDFYMVDSDVSYSHSNGVSSSGVLSFSRGKPVILNSVFQYNAQPAIASGANQEVSATIKYNLIRHNNLDNANRPQINLGPTHPNDTTRIISNSIIGDTNLTKVGGISVSSLLGGFSVNAIMDSNLIRDNRYGITMYNASFAYIRYNTISDNDSEPNPLAGGSGISLYGNTGMVKASRNEISGNYWGVTLLNNASINLGDTATTNYNEGKNTFYNNTNGGITYALYNNTSNTIPALNNCWTGDSTATLADAENVIFHKTDDSSLGEVLYDPIWNCYDSNISIPEEQAPATFMVYPNPAQTKIHFEMTKAVKLRIYSLNGRLMDIHELSAGHTELDLDLAPGLYLLKAGDHSQKLLIR